MIKRFLAPVTMLLRRIKKLVRSLIVAIKNIVVKLFLYVKDWKGREHLVHLGSLNQDKTIYVIRKNANNKGEGLLSIFNYVMARIDYADRNGMIPFVDFDNAIVSGKSDCSYSMFYNFFILKNDLSFESVGKSSNVLLSGWNSKRVLPGWGNWMNCDYNSEKLQLFEKYVDFSDEVKRCFVAALKSINPEECLGLYLRGTDYIKLRPSGHPIQPQLNDVKDEIDRIMSEEKLSYLFLVTEDQSIYLLVKAYYGDKCRVLRDDVFFSEYAGTKLIRDTIDDNDLERVNMTYLIKELVLSRCESFVGGRTNGSSFACAMNGGKYKQRFIYDVGYY